MLVPEKFSTKSIINGLLDQTKFLIYNNEMIDLLRKETIQIRKKMSLKNNPLKIDNEALLPQKIKFTIIAINLASPKEDLIDSK